MNLIKLVVSIFIFNHPIGLFSQITLNLAGTTTKVVFVNRETSNQVDAGVNVKLKMIYRDEGGYDKAHILVDDKIELVQFKQLEKIDFKPSGNQEFWQQQCLKRGVYENILVNGFQYKVRKEMEDEALNYLYHLSSNNLLIKDAYLESYLYSLVYKLLPEKTNDGRPGIVNVHIVKDLAPNAFVFSNGSLFVNTGLLSTVHSEAELLAVLAHEIAHFVLDHAILNINKATQRQKRAEFWSAVATGAAAAVDIYAASKSQVYTPGILTMGTAILSFSIAESINERFGIKYSQEQEMEADRVAVDLLNFTQANPKALSTALSRIKTYCVLAGDYYALSGQGTHPSIDSRINAMGKPTTINDSTYDRKISFINTFNAGLEMSRQHFTASRELVQRNIKANVGTEDDYVLASMSNLYLHDSPEKNKEALDYLTKAKQLSANPSLNIHKIEALVFLRLEKTTDAKDSFLKYKMSLEKEVANLGKINNDHDWSVVARYLNDELDWTQKMIMKANRL